jgi:hypothetical protein
VTEQFQIVHLDMGLVRAVGTPWTRRRPFRSRSPSALTKPWPARPEPRPEAAASLCRQEGIPLLTLAEAGILDVTVDGADEVDPYLDLIKGCGQALVREKIVAASPAD